MVFWIISAILAVAVGAIVVAPLIRRGAPVATDTSDLDIYRDQLAEIDRDIERGVLTAEEAELTRTEVARRLLAADKAERAAAGDGPANATRVIAIICAVAVTFGGLGLYWRLGAADASGAYPDLPRAARLAASEDLRATRPSQDEAMAARLEIAPPTIPEGEFAELVAQLREAVPQRPNDTEGWTWLASTEARLGNYPAAVAAQRHVLSLAEPGSEIARAETIRLLDLMVVAVEGYVSPEAEELALSLIEADARSLPGRYYLGLLYDQTDRPDLAFRLWRGVVADGPADSPHARLARQFIADAAFRAGVEYDVPALPGPTAEQMAAAEDMDPEARAEMIRSMVSNLSDRLARDGGSAADWARLITSLAILGETDRASAILGEAREVFTRNPNDIAVIEAAAAEAGLE